MWSRFALLRRMTVGAIVCLGSVVQAQLVDDPDWKESEAPPPPAFSTARLVAIDMPVGLALRYNVDPDTVRLTPDGIVRYVMVATGQDGAVNAQYEAIRCATAEYKLYARSSGARWNVVRDAQWVALERTPRTLHAYLLARQSLCNSRGVTGHSSEELARRLRHPPQQSVP